MKCKKLFYSKKETRASLSGAIYARGVPLLENEMINEHDFVS